MTGFWAALVVLVGIALAWVLPVLLRARRGGGAQPASAANLALLRDQLGELDRDLANAVISPEQHRQARDDLARRALEEARGEANGAIVPRARPATATALSLAIALPLCAALLYMQLGRPGAISGQDSDSAASVTPQQVEAMIAQLAAKLEKSPDDAAGWAMLGRSYFVLQRFPEAASAYARATSLVRDNADLLADHADALAMSQGRRIDASVTALLERALQIDPEQFKALAMASSAAFDRKDYAKAIEYWQRLRGRAPPDSEFARTLDANISEARQLAGEPTRAPVAVGSGAVGGTVSLSPALAGKVDAEDTVFVYARAAEGPRQPLAVIRRQVKDLPLRFSLDDTQAMAPNMTLSSYPEVVVGARVSKSAQAAPQSGDLQGASKNVKVGASDVVVVIDTLVP